MGDLTRRAFIGRTILTGATIASGGLSTISTSPTTPTVAKVATTWKNLNVLSPKAKAYRTFLKGLVKGAVLAGNDPEGVADVRTSTKTLLTRSPDPAVVFGSESVSSGKNVGRRAFETAIKKPEGGHVKMEARQGVGNPGASDIAADMRTDKTRPKKKRSEFSSREQKNRRKLAARINSGARSIYAQELRAQQVNTRAAKIHDTSFGQKRGGTMVKGVHTPDIQATKTTSTTSKGGGKSGGGGGKFGGNTFGRHSPWSLLRNDKNF